MSSFYLKLLAIIAMTFDHVAHLLPYGSVTADVFHIIGRLTFPIMAFLFLEGYTYTKSKKNYAKRLLIFALVSELPFYFLFGVTGNVMFTFLVTILMFMTLEKHPKYEPLIVLAFSVLAIPFDWGFYGLVAMYIMYKIKDKKKRIIFGVSSIYVSIMAVAIIFTPFTPMMNINTYLDILLINAKFFFPVLFAIPILLAYNGKRGRSMKYFFYIYYPAHLTVLGLINYFVLI